MVALRDFLVREANDNNSCCDRYYRLKKYMYIQGVSGGIVNILGGGSMDYSE